MYGNFGILIVLLISPILAQSLDIDRLVASIHGSAISFRQLPRQLLAESGAYPYVVWTDTHSSECLYTGSSCQPNSYTGLADAAPKPESDLGKYVASVAAKSYLCASHKTSAECLADKENNCQVYNVPFSPTNSTLVAGCDVSLGEATRIATKYTLCPNSLADQFLTCSGMKDILMSGDLSTSSLANDASTATCTSRNGVSCEVMAGSSVCVPTALKKDGTTPSELLDLLKTKGNKFWGCCKGGSIMAQTYSCEFSADESSCKADPKCQWYKLSAEFSEANGISSSITGVCTLSNNGFLDLLVDSPSEGFGKYLKTAVDKCKALSAGACEAGPRINVTMSKAKELSQLQSAPGLGAGCSSNAATYSRPAGQVAIWLAVGAVVLFSVLFSS